MKNLIKLLCISFIIIGIILLSADKIYNYKQIKINNNRVDEYFIKENKIKKDTYIGILEIPKIRLKRGFYDFNSIHNNINENITILKPVMYPNDKNSIFILAAHSGNSYISYFKDLYKLDINDDVYIYYKNKLYKYKIANYYEENKNGKITIKDNSKKSKLILTTCKNKNKQLIYIGHLKEVIDK